MAKKSKTKSVVDVVHGGAKRVGIPTEEFGDLVSKKDLAPVELRYPRNPDLDPQLVWKGKDAQNADDLTVKAMPIFIQEKIHPKTIIADLKRETEERKHAAQKEEQLSLFSDFNGVPKGINKMDFYHYEQNWTNRMILGDSLQVMGSLAEKEGLRGKVQCIYFDPPYGIKFNSNFQWSTTTTNVKDGKDMTQEPEMVKAFRDTWRYGIHSYLSYLRDRLVMARDLLTDSGSIFVQIGDENVHRVRAVLDEVFGEENYISTISFATTSGFTTTLLMREGDCILWYARNRSLIKYHPLYMIRNVLQDDELFKYVETEEGVRLITSEERENSTLLPYNSRVYRVGDSSSQGASDTKGSEEYVFCGNKYFPSKGRHWTSGIAGLKRLEKANRLTTSGDCICTKRYVDDNLLKKYSTIWSDTTTGGFTADKIYVVQTNIKVIARCLLMATDPGDLVLDPTCGSGTTAYVAEQWGRRWITIDTSRVALSLARARIMGARYPYYLLADSPEGQKKESELSGRLPSSKPTYGDIRQGFVYERVPHVTLKSIANNAEIDTIWDAHTPAMDELRKRLGKYEEWEVPRGDSDEAKKCDKELLAEWWKLRRERQAAIDKSIASKAEYEYLYDKPYADSTKVRVSGPFTMESLSPYRSMIVDENDNLKDPLIAISPVEDYKEVKDFGAMILDELKRSGVQQSDKKNRIMFDSLEPIAGRYICANGMYQRGNKMVQAGIFIGPEFGTVERADLVRALREAKDIGMDEVISCAFSYEASAGDLDFPGMPILKARMNADLHMAGELKSTGGGNLFVIFGEPDIDIIKEGDKRRVKINGVDIFNPQTGKVMSSEIKDIACWFVDTNYNEESFFVRQAYFCGQKDPYEALKKTLKSEIDEEAWSSIYKDVSRQFDVPSTGRIAVKIINHLGDEVMKVFEVK